MKKSINEVTVTVKRVWQTIYNADSLNEVKQKFLKPTMTVPDHTMSLVEIIDRFATSGTQLNLGQKLWYDGDQDVEITDDILLGRHWDSFDIDEKHEILKKADADFSKINQGIKLAQKEKAQKLEEERKSHAEQIKMFKEWSQKQKAGEPIA